MAIKRKLTSPKDPVAGGSKKKVRVPRVKKTGAAAEPTASERQFNNERASHLRTQRTKTKGKQVAGRIQARLTKRLARMKTRIDRVKKGMALQRSLLAARFKTIGKNLGKRQAWRRGNLVAKQKLHLKWLLARKPKIVNGKVVTPAVKRPKFKGTKAPKLLPMPRIRGGKIITKAKGRVQHQAGASAAAKKAAKSKKTNAAVAV